MSSGPSPFARPSDPEPNPARRAAGPEPEAAPENHWGQAHSDQAHSSQNERHAAPAPSTPPRSPRRGGLPGWVIPLLAVLVIGGIVAAALLIRQSRAEKPAQPADSAVAYLRAVAEGRAEAALAMGGGKPTSGPLLTAEALRTSNAKAPITDITVVDPGRSDLTPTEVVLGYRRGGKPVQGRFAVAHGADGTWSMQRVSHSVQISPEPKMVPAHLDGITLTSTGYTHTVDVFPGLHTLSTGSPWLEFAEPDLAVDGTLGEVEHNYRLKPTAAYPKKLTDKIDQRLKNCLASTELAPKGCPWAKRARADQPVREGSVRYELIDQKLTVPTPGTVDAIAHGVDRIEVRLKATAQINGHSQEITEEFTEDAKFAVDLLTKDLDFVWE